MVYGYRPPLSNFRGPLHYMAALAAIRHNAILRAFYQRLIGRGKLPKVALTAVMRKLTILLNRLLKNPNFCLVQ